jgi:hypothetical protein
MLDIRRYVLQRKRRSKKWIDGLGVVGGRDTAGNPKALMPNQVARALLHASTVKHLQAFFSVTWSQLVTIGHNSIH